MCLIPMYNFEIIINLKFESSSKLKMDSDDDEQQFAKHGGEALNIGEDLDSEEEVYDDEDEEEMPQ